MTNRPAHPTTHDPTLRARLDEAVKGEVLIPCRDKSTAALVRSRIWALVKAHRFWKTRESFSLASLRTKLVDSYRVNAVRTGANIDVDEHPFCLILDTRDEAAKALASAIVTNAETPLNRSTEPAAVSEALIELEGEEDEDEEENFYSTLSSAYKGVL